MAPPAPIPPPTITHTVIAQPAPPVPKRPQRRPGRSIPGALWLPAGTRFDVSGLSIPGGMVYLGSHLPAENGHGEEPALIVPNLPVDLRRPDVRGESMGYWPSYSRITPAARGAYLRWLAGGRVDPNAYIGYVFLYFYGLERRLFVDGLNTPLTTTEQTALLDEVRRLLSIYQHNGSFRGYAQNLLNAMAVLSPPPRPEHPPTAPGGWSEQLPLELRVGLSQLCAEGTPVPVDWALAWITQLPDTYLRTPATRCSTQFEQLFALRYRESYGSGVVLRAGPRKLSVYHHLASGGISNRAAFQNPRLSEVSDDGRTISALRQIVERATTELDSYSRYLGRHPEGADDSAALALLPPALVVEPPPSVRALWSWADEELGSAQRTVTSTENMLAHWPDAPASGKLVKADMVVLAQLLDRRGIGIEPDVRFGGSPAQAGKPLVLFRRADHQVTAPTPEYPIGLAAVNLGMLVAVADGVVSDQETKTLREMAVDPLDLSPDERRRLEAHEALVAANPPTPAVLRRRIGVLSEDRKTAAGHLLISIAAVDGEITSDEVRKLESLFQGLGLDPKLIYSALHEAATTSITDDEPVVMSTTGTAAPRVPVPRPTRTSAARTGLVLDPALLAAKRAESARAAAQLAEIFAADDEPATAATAVAEDVDVVSGLDQAHSSLFRQLVTREQWARVEVERMAADLGLLPDGALDLLNETAFDHTDGPLWEGDDPITIDPDTAKDMHG
ncbi:TerB N-terminal domain-containing protein [Kutzneria chonburiensis]|uniref:tellurite resistance TerB family protein n=1 Tax=Kutzneria chonburiensis TaxID=1483604 RepID=UPI0023605EBB|nr:TerB N-terminal domain-containing protein [Kutzneria chonburiensis]